MKRFRHAVISRAQIGKALLQNQLTLSAQPFGLASRPELQANFAKKQRKPPRPNVVYAQIVFLNMVPKPIVNVEVGLRPLIGGASPTSSRMEFPKKHFVVPLVVPKGTV
jgi:hypothetical protein